MERKRVLVIQGFLPTVVPCSIPVLFAWMAHAPRLARGISLLTAAVAACACGVGARPTSPVPENALRAPVPRFVGRYDTADPAGPKSVWCGSAIEARVLGSGIAMRLRVPPLPAWPANDPPLYTVRIDDGASTVLAVTPGEKRYVLAERLDPGRPHVIVVTRESEALAGEHQFLGFDLVPGTELVALPPEREARPQIEIIGDSITCGYGVLGSGPGCPFSFSTERASEAYGAIAGAALGADVTTLCWSGRGVYRNFDERDEPTMAELWRPGDTPPAAVVVSLGTNDVLAKWAPFDARAFELAYLALLSRIRDAYRDAWIVVTVSPMLEGDLRRTAARSLERIVTQRRSGGDSRIELLPFEEQHERVGCDSHPNAAMHRIMGGQLEGVLRARLR